MAEVTWIRLQVDMFSHKKIRFIRKLPEGNDILLFWIMLLSSAGKCNSNGYIYLTEEIPYTAEMLSDEYELPLNTIKLALDTFRKLNMIDIDSKGIYISGWEEYQNIEGLERIREQNRERKRKQREREKQKLLSEPDTSRDCHVTSHQNHATEEEVDKEKEKKKKNIYADVVYLTDEEYKKLIEKFGEDTAKDKIEELSLGIKSKGYKYKDHYATILAWDRKRIREAEEKKVIKNKNIQSDWRNFDVG